MDKKKVLSIFAVLLIVAVGLWLRILYLNTDFWYDEACSWFTAKQSFPFGIFDNLTTLDLQHTPLYFFLLHFWIKFFGQVELPMRILSLIFGIATVPMVYVVAKKITKDEKVSLFASILSSVSPLLVLFSVEVRMYSMATFLVMLSLNYLIDFENKNDNKSLVKLVITNLLIPYTLVGGILYNISLFICYFGYLLKNRKEAVTKYLCGVGAEILLLMPYFVLIAYYAKTRLKFVVSHEGNILFFNIIDIVRNFFGSTLINNIYWPSESSYDLTAGFTFFVIVPCVYFMWGFFKGRKTDNLFVKTIYNIFIVCFVLFVFSSVLKINVLTVRYMLYILPPLFILAVIGLSKNLTDKHFKVFLTIFLLLCTQYSYKYSNMFKYLKSTALKTVRLESDKLGLYSDDMIILPFSGDAPYYFRDLSSPRVLNFDFHKQARNPYNNNFYDKSQQSEMDSVKKSFVLYQAIKSNRIISDNFYNYFMSNVNLTVPKGRYVLLAVYGTDANSLISPEELSKSVALEGDVAQNFLDSLFKKTLCDIRLMLSVDFELLATYRKDNYTFLLYQKK